MDGPGDAREKNGVRQRSPAKRGSGQGLSPGGEAGPTYRHAFHAGNFADLLKHACLLLLLERLTAPGASPLTVLDTHGGAGRYDLGGDPSLRSGEARAGVERLLAAADAPEALGTLRAELLSLDSNGRLYPGSPLLTARRLRREDRLLAWELRDEQHAVLTATLADAGSPGRTEARHGDGYAGATAACPPSAAAVLALIDPPYATGDDPTALSACAAALLARNPGAVVAVWAPIKDLDGFDRLLTRLEVLPAPLLIAELRLRPLRDPLRMNGCAMLVLNPPERLRAPLQQAAEWLAATLGEPGGGARVT